MRYDPSPFMLHWDKVKVDPTIIPEKGKAARAQGREAWPVAPH